MAVSHSVSELVVSSEFLHLKEEIEGEHWEEQGREREEEQEREKKRERAGMPISS